MEKLSEVNEEGENIMSFTDVVKGQDKHDVARTFSALLQLVILLQTTFCNIVIYCDYKFHVHCTPISLKTCVNLYHR